MSDNRSLTRRVVLGTGLAASCAAVFPRELFAQAGQSSGLHSYSLAAKCVNPGMNWSPTELNEFLDVIPDKGLSSLLKALEVISPEDDTGVDDRGDAIEKVKNELLWQSSSIITYPFRGSDNIRYHELVKWAGEKFEVDDWIISTQPTFLIERAIQEKLFSATWDKLSIDQKLEVLESIDQDSHLADHAAVASLSAAGALAALSATVHLAGFAFYTTMSVFISTAAGLLGVTLPFAAYTGASATVAFLTGPVGWALIAVAAAAGVTVILGKADVQATLGAICQIHALKVAALKEVGEDDAGVFHILGDPLKRQLVGVWRFDSSTEGEEIEVSLGHDGSFIAEGVSLVDGENEEAKVFWKSKGAWKIRGKRLFVEQSHIPGDILGWSEKKRTLVARNILEVKAMEVILERGVILRRM